MGINFFDLYNKLSDRYAIKNFKCGCIEDIVDIKFITRGQKQFEKQVIFVGKSSDINSSLQLKGACFVLVDDIYENTQELLKNHVDVIILPEDQDIFSVFNYIKEIFDSELLMIKSSADLLNSLIQGKGLNYLINLASKIVDNPIILIDTSYKVISSSSNHKITDELWNKNIQMGYCSYEFISEVKRLVSVKNSINNTKPYMVPCYASPIRRIVSNVFINKNKVGHIIMLESNIEFTEKHWNLLGVISNVVAQELDKNYFFNNSKGKMHEHFLFDLLEENMKDEKVKEERLKSVEFNFNNLVYVLNIDLSRYKSDHCSGYLRDSLETILPNAHSLFYNEHIVLLVEADQDNYFKSDTINRFIVFAKQEQLTAGMSVAFNNVLDFRTYYLQAVNALKIGEHLNIDGPVFYYGNLRFYDLISQAVNKDELVKFCHPSVINLKRYDHENNTNYFETLYYYLKYNGNVNLTAEKLFIHRNTLGYRINKIEDILSMDIKDEENVFQLNYSIKILKYLY